MIASHWKRTAAVVGFSIGLAACRGSPDVPELPPPAWVASWAGAQQIPEPGNALPSADLEDATLRQVIRPSLAGERIRLRVSNVYGTAPLTLDGVSIARSANPATSAIDPGTSTPVTFAGRGTVTIPAGAYMLSDALDFAVDPQRHLAVSMHYPAAPERQTGHPGSRATSYLLHGNHGLEETLPDAKETDHWYQIAGLDVQAPSPSRALVVIGDSITDGFGVEPNTDQRWTDFLIARVHEDAGLDGVLAVLNVGLGGNRLLLDGLGPSGLARFDRDTLGRPGVSHVVVLLGVNDLGTLSQDAAADRRDYERLAAEMIAAFEQLVRRARDDGVRIIGGTIMPFGGSTFYPSNEFAESARQAVNAWIRGPGNFDAVIDFDARMRAADDPARLEPALDSGDHLHPSIAGYRAMAELVPLDLFRGPSR